MPYQCLGKAGNILIAAHGSRLDSFDISNGSRISSFVCSRSSIAQDGLDAEEADRKDRDIQAKSETSSVDIVLDSAPPAKRRKLSTEEVEGDRAASGDATPERRKEKKRIVRHKEPGVLNVAVLTSTRDGSHVIAITGEDKSLRVLKHDGEGHLEQLSERNMPKRPCALALTFDETTIISADKFGDVYALPLLISDAEGQSGDADNVSEVSTPTQKVSWTPAANNLTVHTMRNRISLANQIRQREKLSQNKVERTFEHKLLLGHVSLLTDIKLAIWENRNYIITADRDGHIRISRGIPQTHVIESFCLGHTEFVSRLCLLETHPNILISGGGDDFLIVWKWVEGQMGQKVDLRSHVGKVLSELMPVDAKEDVEGVDEPITIAVSAIQHLKNGPDMHKNTVIVTCESVPSIFLFSFDDGILIHYETIALGGNPLDLIVDGETGKIIVSIDLIHKPGSTHQIRENADDVAEPIKIFEVNGQGWTEVGIRSAIEGDVRLPFNGLSEILYTIENLRKRVGEE